jgi:hypothetical protein
MAKKNLPDVANTYKLKKQTNSKHESKERWHKDQRKKPLQESVQHGDACHQKEKQWTEDPRTGGHSMHASTSSVWLCF